MWKVGIVAVLAALCGVALSLDRTRASIARGKMVDYRVRSQNLHIDHLNHEMAQLENRFEGLSEPVGPWDIRMLAARLRRNEGVKCDKVREVSCGGDYPECVSNLFVCDGYIDCHNGLDEDDRICNSEPVQVGRTYQGVIHWEGCVNRVDHNMIITITHMYHPHYFQNRVYLRATITSDNEELDDPNPIQSYPAKGYYIFARRTLVLLPVDQSHNSLGVICGFHFGDNEHADCQVKQIVSLNKCGSFRVVRA